MIEKEIVELIRAKDKAFVALIYDNYSANLYGVVKAILRDDDLAQDVLQDSFVKIWRNAEQYDEKRSKLFTWLLRICRNTAIDKLRSLNKQSGAEIHKEYSNVYIDENLSGKEAVDNLTKVLAKLNCKYREVLIAIYFRGLTQVEVSEDLDIPLGTVKTRLRIGLRELKEALADSMTMLLLILIAV